ncbi:preprotein translocase subunit YajC [Sphingomonas sp.]|uniref:preprotein translocase subunit YajC n=1 Tax=Sphingomonas sp. TaxID=28214 RepID=UPI003B3A9AC0
MASTALLAAAGRDSRPAFLQPTRDFRAAHQQFRGLFSMFASPAYAQAAGAAPSGTLQGLLSSPLPIMIVIMAIWWVLIINPQRKAQKAQRAKIEAAKKGDTVVTGGGLIGKVIKADGDEVELELGPNVRVRALRSTLSDIRPLGAPAND